jgi:His/Glu/Gln/Arg/opine family amino acid ABC transporter permease subunit
MIEFLNVYRQHFGEWVPELLVASIGTLQLMALSFMLASIIGLVVALMRVSRSPLLHGLAVVYVEVLRGLPALVILFLIYFGLGGLGVEWLKFTSYQAAVIGLGLQGGAVLGEVFRSGIEALHLGQMEAALSLGMTPATAMRWIILPQAGRIVLPPVANYAIGLLKDTAVCAIIAAPELMLRAKDIASSSFRPMHLFVLAAVLYFIMSYPLSIVARRLEARLARAR